MYTQNFALTFDFYNVLLLVLKVSDDGSMMNIMKEYFSKLDEPVPSYIDKKNATQPTKFSRLLLTAFREFRHVQKEDVVTLRKSHHLKVVHGIGNYSKHIQLRDLKDIGKFNKEMLSHIYDKFFSILYYRDKTNASTKGDLRMDLSCFYKFLGSVTTWARNDEAEDDKKKGDIVKFPSFVELIFNWMDKEKCSTLTFQQIVQGIDRMINYDFMMTIDVLFQIHHQQGGEVMRKEEVISFAETLMYLFRDKPEVDPHGKQSNDNRGKMPSPHDSPTSPNDVGVIHEFFQAASLFLKMAFEYINEEKEEIKKPDFSQGSDIGDSPTDGQDPHQPKSSLTISVFRSLILSNPVVERYFDLEWPKSFCFQDEDALNNLRRGSGLSIPATKEIFDSLWGEGVKFAHKVITRKKTQNPNQEFSSDKGGSQMLGDSSGSRHEKGDEADGDVELNGLLKDWEHVGLNGNDAPEDEAG
jgi:hypothetical protein